MPQAQNQNPPLPEGYTQVAPPAVPKGYEAVPAPPLPAGYTAIAAPVAQPQPVAPTPVPTQNGSSNPVPTSDFEIPLGPGMPSISTGLLKSVGQTALGVLSAPGSLFEAMRPGAQIQSAADAAARYASEKQAGYSPTYRAAAAVAGYAGVDPSKLEEMAKQGDTRGILENVAPATVLGLMPLLHTAAPKEAAVEAKVAPASSVGNAEVSASSKMPAQFTADELTNLRDRTQKIIDNPKATPEERTVALGLKQHIEEQIAARPSVAKPPETAPSAPHPAELRANTEVQAPPQAEPVNPLDKKIADVPQENLAPLRNELRNRAAELQAQATNIRDLDSQFSKNAANAQALIDMKKTGGPVRQLATPEGERITVKPDAELGVHARNVLGPLEGKEARFSDADLQSSKFDRAKPTNVSDEDWNKALGLAKAKFFRDRNALVKDIDVANSTGRAVEETDIPERLKDLDQTGQLIWKLPAGETGNKSVTQAPAPEHILRTWDTKTQEAATGKNLKNFNNGKLLDSAQLEQIAKDKEAMAQEHLALATHIDQKLSAPKTTNIYHATTAPVEDIEKLSAAHSKPQATAGPGVYLTPSPEVASKYVARGENARVLTGNLADAAHFYDSKVPLPADIAEQAGIAKGTTYEQALKQFRDAFGIEEAIPKIKALQSALAREGFHGVDNIYENRKVMMMFGDDVLPEGQRYRDLVSSTIGADQATRERIAANAKILQETINPENLKTRADMTKAIDTASDLLVKDSNPRMLHAVADASTVKVAEALGMTPEDLLRSEAQPELTDAKVVAADLALKHNLDSVFNVAEQARTGAVPKDAFFEAMAKHAALQEVVDKKIGREAGRILRARQITKEETLQEATLDRATSRPKAMRRAAFDTMMKLSDAKKQEAIEAFLKIPKDDTFATAKFIRDFARFQEASKLGRFKNAARELYLNALLSGPVGIIKAASDSAMALMTPVLNGIRDSLEQKSLAPLPKDVGIGYHAFLSAIPQAVKAMSESWITELGSSSEFEPRQFAVGGTAGRVARVPTRIAASVNDFFYTIQREMELRLLANRSAESLGLKGRAYADHVNNIVSNPSPAFYRRATDTATINTFNNKIAGHTGTVIKTIREVPGGWWLMPIVKIPTNLAKFGIDMTPLGFAHAELVRRGMLDIPQDLNRVSTIQARAIAGTAAMTWAYNMARQGKLSGRGPSDYKERERLEATGWQPYSVKVGEHWFSYKRLEPIAIPLMAAGTFHDTTQYDKVSSDQSVMSRGLLNSLGGTFEMLPFLESLSALQAWVAGGPEAAHSFTQFAMQETGSLIPTGIADLAHAIDSTYRKPATFAQELESRTPGLTQKVPAVTDVTGQPARRPAGAVGGLNPFPVSPVIHNEVAGEIQRLQQTKPQTGPTVTVPRNGLPFGVAAAKIQISPDEKIALDHQDEQIEAARKKALMDDPNYRRLTDDQKREAFSRIDRQTKESRAGRLAKLRANKNMPMGQ